MAGKRIEFHPEVLSRLQELADDRSASLQELADEAFDDLLKKHRRPVGVRAMLKESANGFTHCEEAEWRSFPEVR